MAIEIDPILPDKKHLVQRIGADKKQLVDRTEPLRDQKGYTCLIDPVTGRMGIVKAIIPMPGDPDYKETTQKDILKVDENIKRYIPNLGIPDWVLEEEMKSKRLYDIHPSKALPWDIHPSKELRG